VGELERPTPELKRRLRKQWGFERTERILDQYLTAGIREFQLSHLDRMHTIAADQLVRRGNRIAGLLEASDNPLNRERLMRLWEAWLRDVEAKLAEPWY
jgi:DNA integrity scanning protein DisA with diadenylate cyclase activity